MPSPTHRALTAALAYRRQEGLSAEASVRLVDGAADELPGLTVETFGPVARLETLENHHRPSAEQRADLAAALLDGWPSLQAVVGIHRLGQGKAEVETLVGHVPAGLVMTEANARFFIRPAEGDAVGAGIFADQRLGRRLVSDHAHGGPALNLFAHAGAFGVVAARGGATRVDHVDAARKCASWAALNLALNGLDPREHRFIVDDALKVQDRMARRGPTYRVVVCDPPTWARRKGGAPLITRDHLDKFAEAALRALLPGGALLLSCNDRRLKQTDFERAVAIAAQRAGRRLRDQHPLPLGPDFRASLPEQRSTKGVWVVLDHA